MGPVSVAGVAHRTNRRTGAVASSTSPASSAAAQQQACVAPAGAPPVGRAATAPPSGCVPTPLNGVEDERGGTTYYRARGCREATWSSRTAAVSAFAVRTRVVRRGCGSHHV